MKKGVLFPVLFLALSGIGYAGGNITPIEPVAVSEVLPYYIGVAYSQAKLNENVTNETFETAQLMLQAGYQINEYFAIEGRYTFGINTDYSKGVSQGLTGYGDISNWGIYAKPMYPIDDFSLYGLLGFGGTMLDNVRGGDAYESSVQYGLGVSYRAADRISLFLDYIWLYDDRGFDYLAKRDNVDANVWALGVSYRF